MAKTLREWTDEEVRGEYGLLTDRSTFLTKEQLDGLIEKIVKYFGEVEGCSPDAEVTEDEWAKSFRTTTNDLFYFIHWTIKSEEY